MFSILVGTMICATPAAGLDGVDTERLSLLREAERQEAVRATIWRWSWGGAYAALTVGQAIAIPFLHDPGDRIDFLIGAISAGLGTIFTVVLPLDVIAHAPKMRDLPATEEGLADGEKLLIADAADESFAVSWVMHLGNVLFNVAIGAVLGLGWQRWTSGVINAVVGTAVGEVMIFTTPNSLRQLTRPPRVTVAPLVSSTITGGLAVGASW